MPGILTPAGCCCEGEGSDSFSWHSGSVLYCGQCFNYGGTLYTPFYRNQWGQIKGADEFYFQPVGFQNYQIGQCVSTATRKCCCKEEDFWFTNICNDEATCIFQIYRSYHKSKVCSELCGGNWIEYYHHTITWGWAIAFKANGGGCDSYEAFTGWEWESEIYKSFTLNPDAGYPCVYEGDNWSRFNKRDTSPSGFAQFVHCNYIMLPVIFAEGTGGCAGVEGSDSAYSNSSPASIGSDWPDPPSDIPSIPDPISDPVPETSVKPDSSETDDTSYSSDSPSMGSLAVDCCEAWVRHFFHDVWNTSNVSSGNCEDLCCAEGLGVPSPGLSGEPDFDNYCRYQTYYGVQFTVDCANVFEVCDDDGDCHYEFTIICGCFNGNDCFCRGKFLYVDPSCAPG